MDFRTIFFSVLVVGMLVFLVMSGVVDGIEWIFGIVALALLTIGGFVKREVITDILRAKFGAKSDKTDN